MPAGLHASFWNAHRIHHRKEVTKSGGNFQISSIKKCTVSLSEGPSLNMLNLKNVGTSSLLHQGLLSVVVEVYVITVHVDSRISAQVGNDKIFIIF